MVGDLIRFRRRGEQDEGFPASGKALDERRHLGIEVAHLDIGEARPPHHRGQIAQRHQGRHEATALQADMDGILGRGHLLAAEQGFHQAPAPARLECAAHAAHVCRPVVRGGIAE